MKKIIIAAITLDGKIAKHPGHDVDWTSKQDKQFFRAETKKAGAVIFGSSTYDTIGRPMPDRLNIVMTRTPEKYAAVEKPGLLEFSADLPRAILGRLEERGFKSVVIGGGSVIYSFFLKDKLVDEIYLTIAPKIFGAGIALFQQMDIPEVDCELMSCTKLTKNEVLVRYKIMK